jgi:hypothetical protein
MKHARELWSKDDSPTPEVTMEEILTRADRHHRQVRRSVAIELIAGGFVVVYFIAMATVPGFGGLPAMSRVGAALIACAAIFVLTYLVLRSARPEPRRDLSTLACYREDLERRRALLASVPKWYIAPFWPGTALFFAGVVLEHWKKPGALPTFAACAVVVIAVNTAIALGNRRAARKLAAELASLPATDANE